jgi:ribokinase
VYDIISVGSATQDIFLFMKKISVFHSRESITGERICFPHGTKIEVDNMVQDTGGGGTNVAVGLARLGLKVGYYGKVGSDMSARAILHELHQEGVHVEHVFVEKSKGTGQSVIMTGPEGERTVFVYRGSNNDLKKRELPLHYFKESRWVYLAPLTGESAEIIPALISFCYKNHILMAMNPNKSFLTQGLHKLLPLLSRIEVLIMNLEEARTLTGLNDESQIVRELRKHLRGVCVITNGHEPAIVCDTNFQYTAFPLKTHPVSSLGAGDAFASGFVSQYVQHKPVEDCIRAGALNANSVLQFIGAKRELLTSKDMLRRRHLARRIRIQKKLILETAALH